MENSSYSYDVTLLGAGPSCIFAALELVSRMPRLRLAIVDAGRSSFERACPTPSTGRCLACASCDVISGFGGAGMFSDGKLHRADDEYSTRVFAYLERFGVPSFQFRDVYDHQNVLTRDLLESIGLTFRPYVSQHVGTETVIAATRKMEAHLAESGVHLLLGHRVEGVIHNGSRYRITLSNRMGQLVNCHTRALIIGFGKGLAGEVEQILSDLEIRHESSAPVIGVRYEMAQDAFRPITGDIIKDPQVEYRMPSGDLLCTFCTCTGGVVVPYRRAGLLRLGGQSSKDQDSGRTNVALLFVPAATDTDPLQSEKLGRLYLQQAASISYLPIIQTLGDFLAGTTEDSNTKLKTTLPNFTYANLNLVLPTQLVSAIKDFLNSIGAVAPSFLSRDNVLSAPVLEHMLPMRDIYDFVCSKHPGAFFVGDMTGVYSGIISSAIMGLLAAEMVEEYIA